MQRARQQIRRLLQTAYQNNQLTTLTFNNVSCTGTVDLVSTNSVVLGLAAGQFREIPLTQITQVKLHQFQSWWHLYDRSSS